MLICGEEVFELTLLWILKASVILTESFRQPLPAKLSPNHPLCYAKWKNYTRSPDWLAVFVAKDTNITHRRFVVELVLPLSFVICVICQIHKLD